MQTQRRSQSQPDPAIELIAQESQVPVDDVARLYQTELVKLKAGARIHGFLHIFAFRKVREMLRRRRPARRPPVLVALPAMATKDPGPPQGIKPAARRPAHHALPARPRLNWTGDTFLL